jgi:hypothetical protein
MAKMSEAKASLKTRGENMAKILDGQNIVNYFTNFVPLLM